MDYPARFAGIKIEGSGDVRRKLVFIIVGMFAVMLVLGLGGCARTEETGSAEKIGPAKKITMVSQNYNEPIILCEVVRQLLEAKTNLTIEHKTHLSGSTICHRAFESGDAQIYVSYTGTQFTGVLDQEVTPEWKDRQKVFAFVRDEFDRRFGAHVFEPFGFENTYALAVRRDVAEEHNLRKVSDLTSVDDNWVLATDNTFLERKGDGYEDLARTYGLQFKKVISMDYGLMYRAVKEGEVNAAVAYSTDGRIKSMDLVTLEDDKRFFPPYDAVLIVKKELVGEYNLEELIQPLIGTIDADTIRRLNYRADEEKADPAIVARDFLVERGLL